MADEVYIDRNVMVGYDMEKIQRRGRKNERLVSKEKVQISVD
jgi:hypothetical protein